MFLCKGLFSVRALISRRPGGRRLQPFTRRDGVGPILLHFFHLDGDFADLAGEAGLRTDADVLGDGCLIVEADISGLIRREDQGLRLFDTAFRDGLSR